MAEPTLLSDIIQPAWQSLTPEQRTCWHFWAAANPQLDGNGQLRTNYGQQGHYSKNADLAVTQAAPLLANPPTDNVAAAPVVIQTYAWPLQSLVQGGTTSRRGLAYLIIAQPLPAETTIIVTQGYDRKKSGKGRPPRIRHVTIMQPLESGFVSLQIPEGYYATTAGDNRYAKIKGVTARRRPDLPLGVLRIIRTTNGNRLRKILANPWGGSRKKTNRARATQRFPKTGDHFP